MKITWHRRMIPQVTQTTPFVTLPRDARLIYFELLCYTDDYGLVYDALAIGRMYDWSLTEFINALDLLSKRGFVQLSKKDDLLILSLCTDFFNGNYLPNPKPPAAIHDNICMTNDLRICFGDQVPPGVSVIGNVDQDTHKMIKNMNRAANRLQSKDVKEIKDTKDITSGARLTEPRTLTFDIDDDEAAPAESTTIDVAYISRIAGHILDGHITGIGSLNVTGADRQAIAALNDTDYAAMEGAISHAAKNGYQINRPQMYTAMVILRYVRNLPKPVKKNSLDQYNSFMHNDYDFEALEKVLTEP